MSWCEGRSRRERPCYDNGQEEGGGGQAREGPGRGESWGDDFLVCCSDVVVVLSQQK